MSSAAASSTLAETTSESLRTEIIESEKAQTDFLRWKLIAVGAIGTLTLANGKEVLPTVHAANGLLACLIPLLCAYVDLISMHLMIRIVTIGMYLRGRHDKYETYTFELRERSGKNPYVFEVSALHGSSLAFDITVLVAGFVCIFARKFLSEPISIALIVCGLLGIFCTIVLIVIYTSRYREVDRLAREIIPRICATTHKS
jgi:uncharacterized membrane protein (DUF485 family)